MQYTVTVATGFRLDGQFVVPEQSRLNTTVSPVKFNVSLVPIEEPDQVPPLARQFPSSKVTRQSPLPA